MLRFTITAAALSLSASVALAQGANAELKDEPSNAQGSNVGVASSQITGNGAVVGGNGTNSFGGTDQTTAPGSRAAAVQALQAAEGRGRDR